MSKAWEVNFDGLIGPSHNYGGLSDGNLASGANKGLVSRPKEAALQGLEKMRLLVKAGLKQGVLPPPLRPRLGFLVDAGFGVEGKGAIEEAAISAPHHLKVAYSASNMWAANAATVSPSIDSVHDKVFLTTANLSTMLHRSLEGDETRQTLAAIFEPRQGEGKACVRGALPAHADFSDEGAANHVRLCAAHGEQGVELFVYGREAGESTRGFPARQTRLASQSIVRAHGLRAERTVLAQQARRAIEAGAFHNDVVCVGTLDTLFFHEFAFEDTAQTLADYGRRLKGCLS